MENISFSKFNSLARVQEVHTWSPMEDMDPFKILTHEGHSYVQFPKWDATGDMLHEGAVIHTRVVETIHRKRKSRIARIEWMDRHV